MNKSDNIRFDSVGSETSQIKKKQERKGKTKGNSAQDQPACSNLGKTTLKRRESVERLYNTEKKNKLFFFFNQCYT